MTAPSPQAREALTEALAKVWFDLEHPEDIDVWSEQKQEMRDAYLEREIPAFVTYLTSPEGTAHVLALRPPAFWTGYQQAVRMLRRYADEHEHEGTYDGICKAAELVDRMRP